MNDVAQGQPQAMPGALPARMLKGLNATYIEAVWPGHNDSGLEPLGDYVLVKMDQCAAASSGGVLLVDEQVERMNEAAESGCIFAIGGGAFTRYDDGRPWTAAKPDPGDRVYVEKYAGIKAMGQDGSMFRIMGYRNIAAGYAKTEESA